MVHWKLWRAVAACQPGCLRISPCQPLLSTCSPAADKEIRMDFTAFSVDLCILWIQCARAKYALILKKGVRKLRED
jgi:hypothetical protein